MADLVRTLNPDGIRHFRRYVQALRDGKNEPVPRHLLTDPAQSAPMETHCSVEDRVFGNRFSFGQYLVERLHALDRRVISRDSGLWTWLALYYFEQLCPIRNGARKIRADEAYILPARYDYTNYYRHLVRTPWLTVADHGNFARVLLIPASAKKDTPSLETAGEIIEQLASRRGSLGNPRVIEAAYRMYFDETRGKPHRGAGGSAGGSPRRLAIVLQQLDLTFDLAACLPDRLLELLPQEFDRWRRKNQGLSGG